MQVNPVFGKIKAKGKKLTKTRIAVVEMLCSSPHTLLTAHEIQERLGGLGISVNKTSVYRELSFLLREKIIKEVIISSGVSHYESALLPHHHHVTCRSCGEIKDIDTGELDKTMNKLEKKIESGGFLVSDHSLEFFGVCANCH